MLLAQGEETINQDELIEKCKYCGNKEDAMLKAGFRRVEL